MRLLVRVCVCLYHTCTTTGGPAPAAGVGFGGAASCLTNCAVVCWIGGAGQRASGGASCTPCAEVGCSVLWWRRIIIEREQHCLEERRRIGSEEDGTLRCSNRLEELGSGLRAAALWQPAASMTERWNARRE
jgi:hypothetical protein